MGNHNAPADMTVRTREPEGKRSWDCLECLCGSPQRVTLLEVLSGAEIDLRSLVDELNSPRTTVQRNVSLLERHGWIERRSGGYATTQIGQSLLDVFTETLESIDRLNTLSPFFDVVDSPLHLDIGEFDKPSVTVPDHGRPHLPMNRLVKTLDTAVYRRGFLPVVSQMLVQHVGQADVLDLTDSEVILSRETVGALLERQPTDEERATKGVEIIVYEDELPYGSLIFEDRLLLAGYDDMGRIQALVESDSPRAIEWANGVYEKYRRESTYLCDDVSD